jgi:nucleoside-diphosphate kinase
MSNFREEKTVVLIKPDGVVRGLIGEVTHRFERAGLKVVALQMYWATKKQMDDHYPKDETWIKRLGAKTLATYKKYNLDPVKELKTKDEFVIGKQVRGWVIDYMTSAPIVKMVVKGVHAVDMVRKMVGATIPAMAEMGTIRADFSVDSPAIANREKRSLYNIIHASETPEEAQHEIEHWFSPEEIHDYKRTEENF